MLCSDDVHICLCCGNRIETQPAPMPPDKLKRAWELFRAIGFTREELLTTRRAQIDFQLPGLAEWLEANP